MHRSIRRGALTSTVVAVALLLGACGGGGSEEPTQTGEALSTTPSFNEQPYENLRDGGEVTLPFRSGLTPQLNRFQGDGTTDTWLSWNWYNPALITFTPNGDPIMNPDYITEATAADSGGDTTVTYTLNPKAVYNDGTPIDWRAFEATWKSNNGSDPAFIPNSTDGYDRITSVTRGVDDRQVIVTFDGVNVWWQSLFNYLVHPKVAADPQIFNQGYLNKPHTEWGAGPYTVSDYDQQNGTLSFERNPKWWGKPGKLDRVTLVTLEQTAKVNAFRNGQIDAAEAETADLLAQAKSVPDADIRISGTPADYLLTLNSTSPVLKETEVRKAIFQGMDRVQLSEIQFQGMGYSEAPSGSLVLKPFQKGYQDNSAVQFDPEAAKQGLDAAGWAPGPDGVRAKGGQPLRFTYVQVGDTATKRAVSGALVAMMKNIGADLQVRQLPSSDFAKVMANAEFDMAYSGFRSSDPYGVAYICQQYCSNSTLNKSGTGTPDLDAELAKVNTLPTADEQYAAANAVEKKALATYGILPVYSGPTVWATKPGLANWGASLFATPPLPELVGWQNGA
ncbi:ABC transporter family substrate-binding protein [Pseudonocardia sp. HH130630-07]|uniref:ABC transporter family substrate-binding protein n=1 Tax=Pseudonocardia sp. HH130630-07 TaxID=1690815 RepID=UPI000814FB85|nr:ABC transporter family substrate-binding protein [Pseudonocardia sp. HH130630-07]ANY08383.1 hypothetical protein AFB00_21230 [Pseudonocardia sp. HH130630-07]